MPVDIITIRASEIPSRVKDSDSVFSAGITGSDILRENNFGKIVKFGEELPIYEFNPDAKKSRLYIGVTKRFSDYIKANYGRDPKILDLNEKKVAAKYINIAKEVFAEKGLNIEIITAGGKIEAMQYVYPDCDGLVEIESTGSSRIANNIEVLEIFQDNRLLRQLPGHGKSHRQG